MAKLASKIAKIEGKKSQVKIGDVREVLKCQAKIIAQELADLKEMNPEKSESFRELIKMIGDQYVRLVLKGK